MGCLSSSCRWLQIHKCVKCFIIFSASGPLVDEAIKEDGGKEWYWKLTPGLKEQLVLFSGDGYDEAKQYSLRKVLLILVQTTLLKEAFCH